MKAAEIRIGLPVVVARQDGLRAPPGYRRGTIVEGPHDVRYGPGNSTWSVAFSSGVTFRFMAGEMEPADGVTRLGSLLSQRRVEQGQTPGDGGAT